jgi:putative sterol carrier protein
MSLESVTNTVKEKVGEDSGLDASIKFDCGDDGVVVIDATQTPNVVTNEDRDAQCTVGIALEDLEAMIAGDLDPMAAFSLGKLRIEGDMGVAMKLGSLVR